MSKLVIQEKEYADLLRKSARFELLESLGVDNWSGYETPDNLEEYVNLKIESKEKYNG